MIPALSLGATWPHSLLGGGEMGARVLDHDWSQTSLGPIGAWDECTRNAVALTVRAEIPSLVFLGRDLVQIYNDAAIPLMVGKHPGRSFAVPWADAWSEVADTLGHVLRESIDADRSLLVECAPLAIFRDGRTEEGYFTFSYSPLRDSDGTFRGVHCITLEETSSVLIARRAETAGRVAQASASQSFDDACRRVAAVLTNDAADAPFAAFYRYESPSTATRVAVSGTAAAADDSFFPSHLRSDAATGWPIEALSLEHPPWVRFPKPALGAAPRGDFPEAIEQAVILPILVAKEAAGFAIAGVNPRIPVTPEYRRFFATIATEMSTALTSTATRDLERIESERQSRASQSFQDASLPRSLPHVPGVDFDAIYVPASDEAKVGGDWYDAVRLPDGRIVVSIGDVAGHGLLAAVTMGNIRQIVRGIAQVHADPALMLGAADRALRLEHPETYVTAWVGVIDLVGRALTFASAGHPPPFLRSAGGKVERLPEGGLPLGLRGETDESARVVALSAGCVLLLYTDGLTELTRDAMAGEREVRRALATVDTGRRIAHEIHAEVIGDAHSFDDVAIVTVHVRSFEEASSSYRIRDFETNDPVEAQSARRDLRDLLAGRGWPAADVANAEAVIGELLGNAVRYAPGTVRVVLDVTGQNPVLHVLDRGPGFEHPTAPSGDAYAESGRGLFIVERLGRNLSIRKRVGGGSHASVVIPKHRAAPALAWPSAPGIDLTSLDAHPNRTA